MKHRTVHFVSVFFCFLILVSVGVTAVICGENARSVAKDARPAIALVEEVTQPSDLLGPVLTESELQLLSRLISAECAGEPFECRVAVAAVVYNRMCGDPGRSLADAIFAPNAFESVANGEVGCAVTAADLAVSRLAASLAAEADPTGGALCCAHSGTRAASEIEVTYTAGGMVFGR